jgi:hypothetical protein
MLMVRDLSFAISMNTNNEGNGMVNLIIGYE